MEYINCSDGTISSAEFNCLSLNRSLDLDLPHTPPDDYPPIESLSVVESPSSLAAPNLMSRGDNPAILDTPRPEGGGPSATKPGVAKRMRRTQACDRCRSRKIRCDASAQKPCSRCRQGRLDCVVRPHARGKRSVVRDSPQPESKNSPSLHTFQTPERNTFPATPLSLESPETEFSDDIPRYLFSESLKRTLWDNYISYVHPLFPIIDVVTIQDEPIGFFIQQGKERLSPLVFLAILYSAVPHVKVGLLKEEGYESYEELGVAIRTDFKRVQNYGVKHDWKTLVHAFLLMSSWYSPKTRSEAWKWSGAAIQLLEKHQDPDDRMKSQIDEAEYRRLWWSCFIRDQLMSLASQSSPRMACSASKISMISEHDLRSFRTAEIWDGLHNLEYVEHPGSNNESQALATLYIELAKLSVILNQFGRNGKEPDGPHRATSQLPDCDKPAITGEETVAQLLLWYCSLDNRARYSQGSDNNSAGSLRLQAHLLPFYQALLLIPYYLTLIKANVLDKNDCRDGPQYLSASRRVLYARQEASRLLEDLAESDKLRNMPTDLTECLLPFATTILLEKTTTSSASPDPMSNRIEGFKQCLKVMRVMMAHDRLQPQNDYRVSLLTATCSLTAELDNPSQDPHLGPKSPNNISDTSTNAAGTAALSTIEPFPDFSPQWQSSLHDDVLENSLLDGVDLNNDQSQLVDSGEKIQLRDDFIESFLNED